MLRGIFRCNSALRARYESTCKKKRPNILAWHGKAAVLAACAASKHDANVKAHEALKNGRFLSHFFACPKTVPAHRERIIRAAVLFKTQGKAASWRRAK
jgi:hypothetical protein